MKLLLCCFALLCTACARPSETFFAIIEPVILDHTIYGKVGSDTLVELQPVPARNEKLDLYIFWYTDNPSVVWVKNQDPRHRSEVAVIGFLRPGRVTLKAQVTDAKTHREDYGVWEIAVVSKP